MTQKTTTKQVTVLAVYKFRKIARICFETLSSNGNDHYHTCFQGNGRESCSCPSTSKKGCYHRDQLRERAQAYFESQKQQEITPAAKLVAKYRDEQGQMHTVVCVNGNLVDTITEAEVVAAVAEVQAERKMDAFKQGPDYDKLAATKSTAAEREAEETRASYMRHFYDEY